jgi:hypothetical protein
MKDKAYTRAGKDKHETEHRNENTHKGREKKTTKTSGLYVNDASNEQERIEEKKTTRTSWKTNAFSRILHKQTMTLCDMCGKKINEIPHELRRRNCMGCGDLETKLSRRKCFEDAVLTAYGTRMYRCANVFDVFDETCSLRGL